MKTAESLVVSVLQRLVPVLLVVFLGACAGEEQVSRAVLGKTATPDRYYTLETVGNHGAMSFRGVGGEIDGVTNPTLRVQPGEVVQVTLVNGDGPQHDIVAPDLGLKSDKVVGKGSSTISVFEASAEGSFLYWCSIPGHRAAGMQGQIFVGGIQANAVVSAPSIVRAPTDLPGPLADRPAQLVRVELEVVESVGQLADGVTYTYWTFGGKVPGPFLRVRVGDTVELHLANQANSLMTHSIDLHAVTGPGGGALLTQVAPGEEQVFNFQALNPGLYVYHCATPMVAHHIANGMYGLILVEPEGGLVPVDREFYVMQGEIYTMGNLGAQEFDVAKLLDETPSYVVFNGAAQALTEDLALRANVGETVRVFFGVGGPNLISSFHIIGEILDRVYDQASLTTPPLTSVQTTLVPAGGATVVELSLEVPGEYILVDHALSRAERGATGLLIVSGDEQPGIFSAGTPRLYCAEEQATNCLPDNVLTCSQP